MSTPEAGSSSGGSERQFYEDFARFSLGKLTVSEMLDRGYEFEHGSYGAIVQRVDEETFERIDQILHSPEGTSAE